MDMVDEKGFLAKRTFCMGITTKQEKWDGTMI